MRLFKHRNGTYYVEFNRRDRGQRKHPPRLSLNTKDKAEAGRLYRQIKAEYHAHKLHALTGQPRGITLGQFMAEYLDFQTKTKSRFTVQTDGVSFRQLLKAFPSETNLSKIPGKPLELWFINLKVKPSSANVWYRHLRAAFAKAVQWGYLKANPFVGIKQLKVPDAPQRYLTDRDIGSICRHEEKFSWRLLWLFMVNTGVRRSEALRVTAPLNFDVPYLELQAKGGKLRRVYLNETVKAILAQHPVQVGLLWPWKPDTVSHHFAATCKKAGIKARVHDLRHTYASNLAMAGIDLRVVQKVLGHSDYKTTQRYEHLTPNFLARTILGQEKTGSDE